MAARRKRDAGIALLTTLIMLLILASYAAVLQGKMRAQTDVISRIIRGHPAEREEVSARATLLPLVGESIYVGQSQGVGPLPLNGETARLLIDDRVWTVIVQDQAALLDLTRTPQSAFDIVLPSLPALQPAALSEAMSVKQALAILGISQLAEERLNRFVTLRNPGVGLAKERMPSELANRNGFLPHSLISTMAAETVAVRLVAKK